jgi:hypothetical protein
MRCRVGTAFAVGVMLLASFGCGSGAEPQAERACGQAVLTDWADGRIDQTYPGPCYLAAIDDLPEDVRAYTSAKDDISRELQASRGGR